MTGTSGRISFILGSISRPVIPGMLMSENTNAGECSVAFATRANASDADVAKSITNC